MVKNPKSPESDDRSSAAFVVVQNRRQGDDIRHIAHGVYNYMYVV